MTLLRRFPILCIALALLAILGYGIAEERVGLLVIAGTLAALSWYVTEGPRGKTLPRWLANLLVIVAAGAMVMDAARNYDDIPEVLGRFTIWLILIKLYERRTARDHAQRMSLSLLLMLIGCSARPPKLLFGAVLLLYGAMGVYSLLLLRLYTAHEDQAAERRQLDPAGREFASLKPVFGRHVVLHVRGLALMIGIGCIALSVLVFLVFPRSMGRGVLTSFAPSTSMSRTTGYTDRVDLTASTRITKSPRIQFMLQLRTTDGAPVRLPGTLLLRGDTCEVYRRGRWTTSYNARSPMNVESPETILVSSVDGDLGIEQFFTFQNPTATLFSLAVPVAFSTSEASKVRVTPIDQTMHVPPTLEPIRRYSVRSIVRPEADLLRAFSRRNSGGARGLYFIPIGQAPGVDDAVSRRNVREEAIRLLTEAGLPISGTDATWRRTAAECFCDHLGSDVFAYTLDLSSMTLAGRDPIDVFLNETRRGHCEFFASALVALCHTVGIEARIVSGYAVSEYDEDEQAYVGRAWNAHAWVEVPIDRLLYEAFDPTPAAALAEITTPPSDLAGRFGWIYEQMEGTWNDRFVDFDDAAQSELFNQLDRGGAQQLREWWASVREWMAQVNRSFYFGSAGYVWMGIVGLALLIATIAIVKFVQRSRSIGLTLRLRRARRGDRRRLAHQLAFYFDMLVLLRRAGIDKPKWQPPLDHARSLEPQIGALVRELVGIYYAGRYGPDSIGEDEQARARDLLRELRGNLGVAR